MTRQQWTSLVADFRRSSLTQAEFARLHGLNLHTFRGWIYRLPRHHEPDAPDFLPLRLVEDAPDAPPPGLCEVELPTGTILRFTERPDASFLASLLLQLEA